MTKQFALLFLFLFILPAFAGGGELDPGPGKGGLPTRLAKDGKQWLSGPVTITLENETTGETATLREDGTCPEFGITMESDWKMDNDWLVWSLDYQGTEKPSGYTMVFEFPVLQEADHLFTPSEKGVVDLQMTPTFTSYPYGILGFGVQASYIGYVLPLASPFDSRQDTGLTIALAPDENIPHLQVDWKDGSVLRFTLRHRGIGQGRTSTLKFLFTTHPADERCVIGAYAKRYPAWFEPGLPTGVLDGAYWYHHILSSPDMQERKRQNVRSTWTMLWWTHFGEYLPDKTEWLPYSAHPSNIYPVPGERMSDERINRFVDDMAKEGISVLAYFDLTEFGGKDGTGTWTSSEQVFQERFTDAAVKQADGSDIRSWENTRVMNPGGNYSFWPHLEEQIKRHFQRLPNIAGFGVDRLDWASTLDFSKDDGMTMVGERSAENLALPIADATARMGTLCHEQGKRLIVNQFWRVEPIKNTDGFVHEWDFMAMGYLSPFKPAAAWHQQHPYWVSDLSMHEANLKKRLQIALFPQMISREFVLFAHRPHAVAADFSEMFVPLFAPFIGKRQVLLPHPISVAGANDCNLFTDINGNWLVPISSRTRFLTKGDRSTESITVTLNVPDANEATWAHAIPIAAPPYKAPLVIEGKKAFVTLPTHGSATMLLIGKGNEPPLPETDHQRLIDVCDARFPEKLPIEANTAAIPDFSGRKVRSASLSIMGRDYLHTAPMQVALNGEVVGMFSRPYGKISCDKVTPTAKPTVTITTSDQGAWWLPGKARLDLLMDDQTSYTANWTPETSPLSGADKVLNFELQWTDKPLPVSTAEFVGIDLNRKGKWQGELGKTATLIAENDHLSTGKGITVHPGLSFTWWNSNSDDPRVLEGTRGLGCWFAVGTGIVFDYTPENDAPYLLSLYCLDYDRRGRPHRMTVTDDFGNLLDTCKLSDDEVKQGVYCTWRGKGPIRVFAELDKPVDAELDEGVFRGYHVTLSGVFVDPVEP